MKERGITRGVVRVALVVLLVLLGMALAPRVVRHVSRLRTLRLALGVSPYGAVQCAEEIVALGPSLAASLPAIDPMLRDTDESHRPQITVLPSAFHGPASSVIRAGESDEHNTVPEVLVLWTCTEAIATASVRPGLYVMQVIGRAGPVPPVQIMLRVDGRELGLLSFDSADGGWEAKCIPVLVQAESKENLAAQQVKIGLWFLNDYLGDLGDRNAEIARVELVRLALGW